MEDPYPMMKIPRLPLAVAVALALPVAAGATSLNYVADLNPLSGSGVSGRATLALDTATNLLDVHVKAKGLTPGQLHVQHIHGTFGPDGRPTQAVTPSFAGGADTDRDGIIELAEGVPFYGPIILNLSDGAGGFPTAPKGKVNFHQIYDLSSTSAFAVNAATDKPFSAEDLLPLDLREIVLHGGFLAEGQGFGPGEADGTAGYKTVLPVAAGVINATTAPVPLPASVWLIAAGLGGLGALRARRKAAA
jgi:hypothetical protein